jgi:hypothetical protein
VKTTYCTFLATITCLPNLSPLSSRLPMLRFFAFSEIILLFPNESFCTIVNPNLHSFARWTFRNSLLSPSFYLSPTSVRGSKLRHDYSRRVPSDHMNLQVATRRYPKCLRGRTTRLQRKNIGLLVSTRAASSEGQEDRSKVLRYVPHSAVSTPFWPHLGDLPSPG